ncbi:type IV pilin [Methanocorpusculaceae archaeon]|nr:type IV pilin [Methanocorpusculaceae archaeon]
MKADVILKKKEDAVSPVIGVMLMLVVTIVIAAVVAAFAGGIATDTEPTPSVVLSADAYKDKISLQSLSGDRLEVLKLKLKVYDETGGHITDGNLPGGVTYFNPGDILKVTFPAGTNLESYSGKVVQIVVTSNDKHTVFNKEVIVKS